MLGKKAMSDLVCPVSSHCSRFCVLTFSHKPMEALFVLKSTSNDEVSSCREEWLDFTYSSQHIVNIHHFRQVLFLFTHSANNEQQKSWSNEGTVSGIKL